MRLSVLDEQNGSIFSFDVDPEVALSNLKALIEAESRVPSQQQTLLHNGVELKDTESLNNVGVKEDDLLYMRRSIQQQQQQQLQRTSSSVSSGGYSSRSDQPSDLSEMDPQQILQHFRSNPQFMQQIQMSNPQLHSEIMQGKTDLLMRVLAPMIARQRATNREQRLYERLEANPFDTEAQRELEQMIQDRNIEENYLNAMEHSPESFASVIMLYIDCKVNDVPLKAFIDSGAQMSIMSRECAERCNLLRLMDTRFQGMALGVGSAKIVGRIHLTTMQIGQSHFPITITVLDQKGMDFLLGLDMLKRHQCQIDLKDGVLRIGPEAAPFLQEKDLKDVMKREHQEPNSPLSPKFSPSSSSSSGSSSSSTAQSQPQPPQQQQQQQQQQTAGGLPPNITEDMVKSITDLGFPRQQAIDALIATNGNIDAAASLLFQ